MVLGTFSAWNRAVSHPPYRTKTETRFDSRSIFPWLSLQLTWPSENRRLDVFQTRGTIVEKFSARVRFSIHMPDGFSRKSCEIVSRGKKESRSNYPDFLVRAKKEKATAEKKASRCRNDSQRLKTRCFTGVGEESRIVSVEFFSIQFLFFKR